MMTLVSVFLIISYLFLGVQAVLIWAMHQRVEKLGDRLSALATKVKDGEHVIIENFEIVENHLVKLDHEIKDARRNEAKAEEALKTIRRIERSRNE